MSKGWQTRSANELWLNAPSDANLGILGDGILVQVDCDDLETSGILWKHQEGLGINVVGVLTKRGDRFYLRVTDLPDFKTLKMKDPFLGEVINKWQGVGAPSVVEGWQYKLFGDLSNIPVVEWRDFVWLLPEVEVATLQLPNVTCNTVVPVKLLKRPAPAHTKQMLVWLETAREGQPVTFGDHVYPSRSEVVRSVLCTLILYGWTFEDVTKVINYKGFAWLEQDYQRAVAKVSSTGLRPELLELYRNPPAFEGRTRGTDKRVFQAVVSLAWLANSMQTYATVRDVATLTGSGIATAWRALQRMCRGGVLVSAGTTDEDANIYRVPTSGQSGTNSTVCSSANAFNALQSLWQSSCLGTTAGAVYGFLSAEPKNASDLAELVQCHRRTAKRNLAKLAREGLATSTGQGWVRGKETLEAVGTRWDVAGRAEKRRKQFARERRAYRRMLKGKAND